jgi:hypothetical protein
MVKLTLKPDSEIAPASKDYVKFLNYRPQLAIEVIEKYRKPGEVSGILYGPLNDEIGKWEIIKE